MKIASAVFAHNSPIPFKYTCQGENINPPLEFIDIPEKTQSLVLIVDDPDAPSKTWLHWLVYNIDPNIKSVAENSKFESGEEGITDFGSKGYGGPCPPSGVHRYFFKLYALDTTLEPMEPTLEKIKELMEGHVIDKAELIGLYQKTS